MIVESPWHIVVPVAFLISEVMMLEFIKKKWSKDENETPEMRKARNMLEKAMLFSGVIFTVLLYAVLSGTLQQWME